MIRSSHLVFVTCLAVTAASGPLRAVEPSAQRALIQRYCVTCHNQKLRTGGLVLDGLDVTRVGDAPDTWEKVVRKLRGGLMPPSGSPRPDKGAYDGLLTWLEQELDHASVASASPG